MPVIHIGTNSEYIKIGLPPSYSIEGWAQADVEISVSGFRGRLQPWVEAADFEAFAKEMLIYWGRPRWCCLASEGTMPA